MEQFFKLRSDILNMTKQKYVIPDALIAGFQVVVTSYKSVLSNFQGTCELCCYRDLS